MTTEEQDDLIERLRYYSAVLQGPYQRAIMAQAANEIERLRVMKEGVGIRIADMQREIDMIKAENEYLKNTPGVR